MSSKFSRILVKLSGEALLGSEGRTGPGFLGLAAGLALGLVLLALIAILIRATTVRLPLGSQKKSTRGQSTLGVVSPSQ